MLTFPISTADTGWFGSLTTHGTPIAELRKVEIQPKPGCSCNSAVTGGAVICPVRSINVRFSSHAEESPDRRL
jgi:hypothetical protein